MNPDKIRKEIASLPHDDPPKCEGRIRTLHKRIQALDDVKEKERLLSNLQEVACYGLSKELNDMMKKKGLAEEFGLELVLQFITSVPELAQHLHDTTKDTDEKVAGLAVIRKRIGEEIEVLGSLKAKGVDIEKEWAKKLCQAAPSLNSLKLLSLTQKDILCQGASREEMAVVSELMSDARTVKPTDSCSVSGVAAEKTEKQEADKERVERAKELMNEARTMAGTTANENKGEINKKMVKLFQVLELPPDWYKQDIVSPDTLMKELNEIIKQINTVVESQEVYSSVVDVVTKASGGRALRGICYSEYDPPMTASLPILLPPTNVSIFNPSLGMDRKFMKFMSKGAAAEYTLAKESSCGDTAVALKGFKDLIIGEMDGAYGFESDRTSTHTMKSSTTSVSVLESISITKKEFQIEADAMNLTVAAKELAMSIENSENKSETARSFLKRFGSHVDGGVQKVGGIFFSIADAVSDKSMETSEFSEAAVNRLQSQISAGFVGGVFGAGGNADLSSSSGNVWASWTKKEDIKYTFSVKTIGPTASNPETFGQLLDYNSQWAHIAGGPPQGYIPVWELLRKHGGEFQSAADILEQIWKEDEAKKKEQRREEDRKKKLKKIEKTTEGELKNIKDEHMNNVEFKGPSYRPDNSELSYSRIYLGSRAKQEDAYNKATEFILEDPGYHICDIILYNDEMHGQSCRLECFTAPRDIPVTFSPKKGEDHVLFFSRSCFKQKKVPERTGVKQGDWYYYALRFYKFILRVLRGIFRIEESRGRKRLLANL